MADRKEVMTWLKICGMGDCSGCCPYRNGEVRASTCYEQLMTDALSLLKEQEVPDTNVGKWVSVKDRLPESVANRVIVWVKDAEIYGHIGFGHYEKYKGQEIWFNLINNEAFEIRGQTVTHWMQLPEMPKEE